MSKIVLILYFLLISAYYCYSQPAIKHGRIKVSDSNPHYLQYEDGTPFFWLGDTGWEMFLRLSREDAKWYIDIRKNQGFNIIQAVLITEFEGINKKGYYNNLPFIDGNPENPDLNSDSSLKDKDSHRYWDNIDSIVKYSEDKGMYLALLPCWGEYVIPREGKLLFKTRRPSL